MDDDNEQNGEMRRGRPPWENFLFLLDLCSIINFRLARALAEAKGSILTR